MSELKIFVVKCLFPSTSITLRISAKSEDDAIAKAKRSAFGKRAVSWQIVS